MICLVLLLFQLSTSSLRLDKSLSLNTIRTLEITLSALENANVSSDRLDGRVRLDKLTIVVDLDPYEEDDDSSSGLVAFDFGSMLLPKLDPTELVVKVDPDEVDSRRLAYRLSTEPATAISSWTRLRTICLYSIDLVWGDEDPLMHDASDGISFLGVGGEAPIVSTDLSLVWDITSHNSRLPCFGWDSIIDLLVKRDEILFHSSITSIIVRVKTQEQAQKLQEIMRGYEGLLPPRLGVIVAGQEPS